MNPTYELVISSDGHPTRPHLLTIMLNDRRQAVEIHDLAKQGKLLVEVVEVNELRRPFGKRAKA